MLKQKSRREYSPVVATSSDVQRCHKFWKASAAIFIAVLAIGAAVLTVLAVLQIRGIINISSSSLPSLASLVGSANSNMPSFTPFSLLVANGTGSTLSSLPSGLAGTFLQSNGASSFPSWVNISSFVGTQSILGTSNQIGVTTQGSQTTIQLASPLTTPGGVTVSGPLSVQGAVSLSAPLTIANGGTGLSIAPPPNYLLLGGSSGSLLASLSPGTSGYVLQSNGAAYSPSWVAPPATGITAVTGTASEIAVSTTGSSVAIGLPSPLTTPGGVTVSGPLSVQGAVSLSAPLTIANGGTGSSNPLIQNGLQYASSPQTVTSLDPGPSGYVLQSGGSSSPPVWISPTAIGTSVPLPVAVTEGGTGNSVAPNPNSLLVGNSGGTQIVSLPSGTSGYVLQSNGPSTPPTWVEPSSGSGTPVVGTVNQINSNTVSNQQVLELSSSLITPGSLEVSTTLNVQGQVTLGFPLPTSSGGTGISSPTPNALTVANPTGSQLTSLPTGTAGYVLQSNGASSPPSWVDVATDVTGTVDQVVATTGSTSTAISLASPLTTPGAVTVSGNLVVEGSTQLSNPLPTTSGGTGTGGTPTANSLVVINPAGTAYVSLGSGTAGYVLQSNGGSSPPTWIDAATNVQGTANEITATTSGTQTTISLPSAITTPGSLTVSSNLAVSGTASFSSPIPVTSGGTGSSTALTQYALKYASSSSQEASLATGSSGQVLVSGGTTGAPSWTSSPSLSSLILSSALAVVYGGTGSTAPLAQWALKYALSSTQEASLATGNAGQLLTSGGTSAAPSWTSVVPVANGGTGSSAALVQYALQYASSTTAMSSLGSGAAGAVLQSGGTLAAPQWVLPLPVTSGGSGQNNLLTQYALMYAATATAQASLPVGTAGEVLTSGGASNPPQWVNSMPVISGGTGQNSPLTTYGLIYGASPSAQASLGVGTSGQILQSAGTTQAPEWTSSPTLTSMSLSTPLAVSSGGTGTNSFSSPNAIVTTSSNGNSLQSLTPGTAGTVLVSGGTGQTPQWTSSPAFSTLTTSNLVIPSSTASPGLLMTSLNSQGQVGWAACTNTSYTNFIAGNNGISVTMNTASKTVTFGLAVPVSVSNGGTGSTASLTPNALIYAANSSAMASLPPGPVNSVLQSQGSSAAPTWTTSPTLQSVNLSTPLSVTSGGTGSSAPLTPNGIVYAASATQQATLAPGSSGTVLTSQGSSSPPTWSAPPQLYQVVTKTFNESGTFNFTFPNNVVYTYMVAIGGGGGGGTATGTYGGGGGGGGGLSIATFPGAPTGTVNIMVGAGGLTNQVGGTTTIEGYLSATGGNPGGSSSTASNSGGAGGIGYNMLSGAQITGGTGGAGGSSSNSNGSPAPNIAYWAPTGGGGGCLASSTALTGGAGGSIIMNGITYVAGGAAGNVNGGIGQQSNPLGLSKFCGSGGGGAGLSTSTLFGSPATGGYGGGGGGAAGGSSMSGAPGGDGFVFIVVYVLG